MKTKIAKLAKSNLLSLVLAILLAISLLVATTFSAFSSAATATGIITFTGNVVVEVKKGYMNYVAESNNGYSDHALDTLVAGTITYPFTVDYSEKEVANGLDYIYGDLQGEYGILKYQTGASTNSSTPDVSFRVSGEGQMYFGIQLELKFTPDGTEGNTFADFASLGTTNSAWNLYPAFNSTKFGDAPSPSSMTVDEEVIIDWLYVSNDFITIGETHYGLMVTAPVAQANGTESYSKIYKMFLMQSSGDPVVYSVARTPVLGGAGEGAIANIDIALSNIISEFRFAYTTVVGGVTTEMSPMTGGSIEISTTAKASLTPFVDF